jgi:hypothetical protein
VFQKFINAGDGFARDLLHLLKQAARRAGNLPPFPVAFFGVAQIAAGKTVMRLYAKFETDCFTFTMLQNGWVRK